MCDFFLLLLVPFSLLFPRASFFVKVVENSRAAMSGLAAVAADLPNCAVRPGPSPSCSLGTPCSSTLTSNPLVAQVACLLTAVLESPCNLTDQACVCTNAHLQAQSTACVIESCTIREGLLTRNLTSTGCGVLPRQEHNYLIVLVVFFALSALAVFLRIVARLQARVPMWWDDFIIGLSFVCYSPDALWVM